ncbi:MAG TPA: hypothetical protein VLR49_06710 [Ferruginibacter sp.]|nr:hypothetical protein [Ferruginibacter sp.]
MLHLTYKLAAAFLFSGIFLFSCNTGNSGKQLNNKEDSLNFAREIIQKYGTNGALLSPEQDTPVKARTLTGKGVEPITWDTVMSYQDYYDKDPLLFSPEKKAYKGFSVDPRGYSMITGNSNIKGLYLRLGRKADGAYTIMILGTDSLGNILQKNNVQSKSLDGDAYSNFDNTTPCPDICPENDDDL